MKATYYNPHSRFSKAVTSSGRGKYYAAKEEVGRAKIHRRFSNQKVFLTNVTKPWLCFSKLLFSPALINIGTTSALQLHKYWNLVSSDKTFFNIWEYWGNLVQCPALHLLHKVTFKNVNYVLKINKTTQTKMFSSASTTKVCYWCVATVM